MSNRAIRKLKGVLKENEPVQYFLPVGEHEIYLNEYLGKAFSFELTGEIHCLYCDRQIKKSYNQGYCFPCSQTLARCDFCIIKPEQCHFHLGTCREPEWGLANCFIPHVVYLANTSGLKVGITRETQIPTRWIDQGATQALPLFKVQNRYQSGLLEVELKKKVNDKTDWRKMLKGESEKRVLTADRDELLREFDYNQFALEIITDKAPLTISYPVLEYPSVIKSLDVMKTPKINSTLLGVKGQYLIFEAGVLNIRNLSGYHLTL